MQSRKRNLKEGEEADYQVQQGIPKSTLKDNNTDCGSNLPDEKDQNYYRLKQGIPRSIKFRSITNIYECTNRLSPVEDEYNWGRSATSEKKKSKVHRKGKTGRDQEGSFKKTLSNKQKQKTIHGEFETISEDDLEVNPKKNKRKMMDDIDTSPTIEMTNFEGSQKREMQVNLEQSIPDMITTALAPLITSPSDVQKKQQDHANTPVQLPDTVAELEASRGGDMSVIEMDLSELQKDVEQLQSIGGDFLIADQPPEEVPYREPTTMSTFPTKEDTKEYCPRETLEDVNDDYDDVKTNEEGFVEKTQDVVDAFLSDVEDEMVVATVERSLGETSMVCTNGVTPAPHGIVEQESVVLEIATPQQYTTPPSPTGNSSPAKTTSSTVPEAETCISLLTPPTTQLEEGTEPPPPIGNSSLTKATSTTVPEPETCISLLTPPTTQLDEGTDAQTEVASESQTQKGA